MAAPGLTGSTLKMPCVRLLNILWLSIAVQCHVALAVAAPPTVNETFVGLSRKTLAEFDSEVGGLNSSNVADAREHFQKALKALEAYDFQRAADAFAESRNSVPTDVALFNQALAAQLTRSDATASDLYQQALLGQPRDHELYLNLAHLLESREDGGGALHALNLALDATRYVDRSEDARGRVLLHRAILEYRAGARDRVANSLDLAEAELSKTSNRRGLAVVKAKRAWTVIARGEQVMGEHALLAAIEQLRDVGAPADEAEALTDLGNHYITVGATAKCEDPLVRALGLARAASQLELLAGALNNLGLCRNSAESEDLFRRAIEAGRTARSPNREAEATNNLAVLFARQGRTDEAYKSFVRAIRLYRNAGQKRRAVGKALDLAHQFEIWGQHVRQKYFVDLASAFLDGDNDASMKARLALEQGRYYLHSDLDRARENLQQAHRLYEGLNDPKRLREVEDLQRAVSSSRTWSIVRVLAGGAATLCLLLLLFQARRGVRSTAVSIGNVAAWPVQSLRAQYLRWEHWWARRESVGPALQPIVGVVLTAERRVLRTLFWTVAVTALLMEAMEVALPNAKYISGIKAKTAEWGTNALLLPADLLEQMQGLLTYLQVSIFASLLVQLVVMALAVVIALFSYSAVIAGVEGLLRRFTPLPQRMPDGLSAADLNSFLSARCRPISVFVGRWMRDRCRAQPCPRNIGQACSSHVHRRLGAVRVGTAAQTEAIRQKASFAGCAKVGIHMVSSVCKRPRGCARPEYSVVRLCVVSCFLLHWSSCTGGVCLAAVCNNCLAIQRALARWGSHVWQHLPGGRHGGFLREDEAGLHCKHRRGSNLVGHPTATLALPVLCLDDRVDDAVVRADGP